MKLVDYSLDSTQVLIERFKVLKVALVWVPCHKAIAGNDNADALARLGDDTPFAETAIGLFKRHTRSVITELSWSNSLAEEIRLQGLHQ